MTNSRNKGNSYERDVANVYRAIWYDAKTTRNAWSKELDNAWVDIVGVPWNIQCKNYTNFSSSAILDQIHRKMPKDKINLVHVKITRKWEMVCMSLDDWMEIVEILKENDIFIEPRQMLTF